MRYLIIISFLLFLFNCNDLPKLEKRSMEDIKKFGLMEGGKELKELKQIAMTYSKEEVAEAKRGVFITRSSLRKLDDSLNDYPIKILKIFTNKFPKRRLNFPAIKSLEELKLGAENFTEIKFKGKLPKLKKLRLDANHNMTNFPDLSNLPVIEELDMTSLSFEPEMKKIAKGITHIPDGPVVPTLRRLRFWGSLKSLKNIDRFPNLHDLMIEKSNIESLEGIEKLTGLVYLGITNSKIKDFSALKGNKTIRFLNFSGNNLTEIPDFSDMKQLWSINLMDNKISSMEGIKRLTWVESWELAGNPIKRIEFLELLENDVNGDPFWSDVTKEITRASWEKYKKGKYRYTQWLDYAVKEGKIKIIDE